MGATAAILTIANTGFTYLNQRKQASAAEAQGAYEGAALRQNASLADAQAADAISRGQVEESRYRLGTRQQIGSTRAGLAAQGVDLGSGSALDVQASEASIGELDALTIRNNAAREAWGFNVDALNFRQQAKLAEFGGKQAAAGYRAQSVSTLLTGAANTYGIYQSSQRSKADGRSSENKPSMGKR